MNKEYITWSGVQVTCNVLAKKILELNPLIEFVVPVVGRGGLVPASIIAYKLNVPILDQLASHSKNICVIDDICDTGRTMRSMKLFRYPNAVFASMYVKPSGLDFVNLWRHQVPQDLWVVFPWAPNDEINR